VFEKSSGKIAPLPYIVVVLPFSDFAGFCFDAASAIAVPVFRVFRAEHFGNVSFGYGFRLRFSTDLPVEDLSDIGVVANQG
jgi:hypothetical protein